MSVHEHAEHTLAEHTHGEGCGHDLINHGDHVDYIHDGHLHHADGDHYDEHIAEHTMAEHTHGESCGHDAIKHGDHIDYVHDGHLHHADGDHYDEHAIVA
ncbi:hypothetical protein [Arcanobacterium canis]